MIIGGFQGHIFHVGGIVFFFTHLFRKMSQIIGWCRLVVGSIPPFGKSLIHHLLHHCFFNSLRPLLIPSFVSQFVRTLYPFYKNLHRVRLVLKYSTMIKLFTDQSEVSTFPQAVLEGFCPESFFHFM